MPKLPLPWDSKNTPYLANADNNGNLAVPTEQYMLVNGVYVPVSSSNPLPTQLTGSNATKLTSDGTSGGTNLSGQWGAYDGATSSAQLLGVGNQALAFNESTWDRVRNNTQGTLLASAARTAMTTTPNQTNYNSKSLIIFINISAASGTGGLTFRVYFPDPVTGNWVGFALNSTPITSAQYGAYIIGQGVSSVNGFSGVFSVPVPRTWFLNVSHGDGTSYTYSTGYSLIV